MQARVLEHLISSTTAAAAPVLHAMQAHAAALILDTAMNTRLLFAAAGLLIPVAALQGCMDFLLGESAAACELRRQYVFKIVPMLNPDGVINGSYRCGLAGCDLNRQWDRPSATLHPTIYHTRRMLQQLADVGRLHTYVDMHGHSLREGAFMFGCDPTQVAAFKQPASSNTAWPVGKEDPERIPADLHASGAAFSHTAQIAAASAAASRHASQHQGTADPPTACCAETPGLSEQQVAHLRVRMLPWLLGQREPLFDYKVRLAAARLAAIVVQLFNTSLCCLKLCENSSHLSEKLVA